MVKNKNTFFEGFRSVIGNSKMLFAISNLQFRFITAGIVQIFRLFCAECDEMVLNLFYIYL